MNRIARWLLTAAAAATLSTAALTTASTSAVAAPRATTAPAAQASADSNGGIDICVAPDNPVWGDALCPSR